MCVGLGRTSVVSMKNAGNLLRYLYHFLSADDVTTESFSVRVCLAISLFCFSENREVVIVSEYFCYEIFFSRCLLCRAGVYCCFESILYAACCDVSNKKA